VVCNKYIYEVPSDSLTYFLPDSPDMGDVESN
jgi:hypothetical protein